MFAKHLLLVAVVVGCGHPSSPGTSDGSPGDDDATLPPDGVLPDGAPPDGPPGCVGAGQAARVSIDTLPGLEHPRLAVLGDTSLAVFGVVPGIMLDRAPWATIENGAVVDHGFMPSGFDPEDLQLLTLAGKFYAYQPGTGLYQFDGTSTWTSISPFVATKIFEVGGKLVGIYDLSSTYAYIYDGTTATMSMLSSKRFGDAAMDPTSGKLGVLTRDTSSIEFQTYDGTTWSSPTTVAGTPSSASQFFLASTGQRWAAGAAGLINGTYVWFESGGAWTATPPPGTFSSPMHALVANPTTDTFAIADYLGDVARYKTTWTVTDLTTTSSAQMFLRALGGGFAYILSGQFGASAWIFDGNAWSTGETLGGGPVADVTIAGTTLAATAGTQVHAYDGAWSHAQAPVRTHAVSEPTIDSANGVHVAYTTPGVVDFAAVAAASFGTPLSLPVYASSGPVTQGLLARGANHQALAVWMQFDDGVHGGYAATYDGCRWSAPIPIGFIFAQTATLAAVGSTYVLADGATSVRQWTGTGFSAPTLAHPARVGSDGTTFVAVWAEGQMSIQSATSPDGVTWSQPMTVATGTGLGLVGASDGPFGMIAWGAVGFSGPVSAWVWHAGAWSAAASVMSSSIQSCAGSVADDSALVACTSPTQIDVALYRNNGWASVPIATSSPFVLGSDGHDYRIDYGSNTQMPKSAVLHDGAWSAPIAESAQTALSSPSIAGRAGTWFELGSSGDLRYHLAAAQGATAYGVPVQFLPDRIVTYYQLHPFVQRAGETDAVLVLAHPLDYARVSVLDVALDL